MKFPKSALTICHPASIQRPVWMVTEVGGVHGTAGLGADGGAAERLAAIGAKLRAVGDLRSTGMTKHVNDPSREPAPALCQRGS